MNSIRSLGIILILASLSGCASPPPKPSIGEVFLKKHQDRKSLIPDYTDEQLSALSTDELVKIAKASWAMPGMYSDSDRKTARRASITLTSKVDSFSNEDLLLMAKRKPPFEHGVWIDASKRARLVYLERSDWPESIKAVIRDKSAQIGMTPDQVIISMGLPERVNTTANQYGTREQWVYDYASGPSYLYFENGVLSSWQQSSRR